jgi:hypothetical protein
MKAETIEEAPACADPLDAAQATLQAVRDRIQAAISAATGAQSTLSAATAARAAFVRAAFAGEPVDDAALKRADQGIADVMRLLAFRRDVIALGDDALTSAQELVATENRLADQRRLIAEEVALNADLRARLPGQPDDAELLAVRARDSGFLQTLVEGTHLAYNDAYNHWVGPPNIPHFLPRARVITEGQDWQRWMQWADAQPFGRLPGCDERNWVRKARICLAARDHFTAYTKLGMDQIRRLHSADFVNERGRLPTWRGMVAPGLFVPLGV